MTEDFTSALVDCIKACGGSKVVGPALWPAKTPECAQRSLLACMNDSRPERLTPDQVVFILRMARKSGCHVGIEFLCADLGYTLPTPIEPRDEVADLMRAFNESVVQQKALAERIEKAAGRVMLTRVA